MKRLFNILCAILLLSLVGCHHEEIWEELRDHEQRIEQLEKKCRELNSNIEAIQAILTAIQQNDYVTEIMKIMEDGVEVGYSITFAKAGTVTIYHGTDGAAGSTPDIGIKKASDGAYYWTSDGEWLTDDEGNMIPATVSDPDGGYVTPQFRVADGKWYVSYDNGNSWKEIGRIPDEEENEEEEAVQTNRSKAIFDQFIKLVSQNYIRHRNVGFYADKLCLTPKYLSKLIKDTSGRSAPEWIDSYVVLEAKNLLKYSNAAIKEIVYTLNFPNQSVFYKFFKARTGMTPSEYRNS